MENQKKELDLIDLQELQEIKQLQAADPLYQEDYENGFVPLLDDDEEEIYK